MSFVVAAPANVQQLTDLAMPVYALPPSGMVPEPISISPSLLTTDEVNSTTDTAWPMGANILRNAGNFTLAPIPLNPSPYMPLNPVPYPVNPPLIPLVPRPSPIIPVPSPLNPVINPLNPIINPLNPTPMPLQPVTAPFNVPMLNVSLPQGVNQFGNTLGATLGAKGNKWEAWMHQHKWELAVAVIVIVLLAIFVARKRRGL